MATALEFNRVTKQYRSLARPPFRALDDFSLAIQPGEIFGFLGPNGAGKTTAIHIALGLMSPTSGGGLLLGRPFGHARTRRRVGFLAENVAFYHRSAESLVRIAGRLNAIRDPELAARSKDLLQLLDLQDVAGKSVSKFSRGMLQRVGLAQALVNDPDLLILDEPTSALDTAGRVTVRELLLRARDKGKTIFLSSHLLSEIELVCDRVGILHQGRLLRLGTVPELLESRAECDITSRNGAGLTTRRVRNADQRATVEQIWSCGGEVVSITPVRRSLEDLFLELTGGAKELP